MLNYHSNGVVNISRHHLQNILHRAQRGDSLSRIDIHYLLDLEDSEQVCMLFKTARKLRRRHFGEGIYLYGFIYTSTYCRNNCRFCFYRRSNHNNIRYRKTKSEILAVARDLAESGVHLIDLTMGEDPILFKDGGVGFNHLVDLVGEVSSTTGLPVMISPGVMTNRQLAMLAEAGAAWYACYQETHSRGLFKNLRPQQNFDLRMVSKADAHHQGLLIEEGLLCGVGETLDDLAHSLSAMQEMQADQIRIMSFIAQAGTPMAERFNAGDQREILLIAIMRLVFPHSLIPASMDVHGVEGLKRRLDAGANVVTSIVPPGAGLAGVARPSMGIEDGSRTVRSVTHVLESCDLKAATQSAYEGWIAIRKQYLKQNSSHPIFASV